MFRKWSRWGMLHRASGSDPAEWPRAPDVLRMATENGARVLGIDAGVLRPGALADVVLVRQDQAATLLLDDTLEGLLLRANGAAVDRMVVGGETVLAGGRVLAFDEEAVLAEAAGLRQEVLDRASHRLPDVRAALPTLAAALNAYTGE